MATSHARRWNGSDAGWKSTHGVDFPALAFLYETIDGISLDGEVTEDELDRLALAIERVLPRDTRLAASAKRREARAAWRAAEREARRRVQIAAREERRAQRDAARVRAGLLLDARFPIRGAFRSEERRQACERLLEGDEVNLEREPDNPHDANAILVLGEDEAELGYVPRDEARDMAPLLDAGAEISASVQRLWETPDGRIVPILVAKLRRGEADISAPDLVPRRRGGFSRGSQGNAPMKPQAGGCAPGVGCLFLLLVVLGLVMVIGNS